MGGRQRLGVQDALWLEMDEPGNLMVVDSLFWTAAPIDWDRYRDVARERLWDRFPVFRSVVVRGDDGAWWWEEQPGADPEDRYEHVRLPEPGGDAELQALIAAQRTVPLDRSEPLWRAVLVDGYRGGSAVLFRAHHAIADGVRMVQLAFSVFDPGPEGIVAPPAAPRASRRGIAGTSRLLARGAVTNPAGAAHTALTLTGSLVGSLVGSATGDVDTLRKLVLGTRNDSTCWTGTVGEHKAIAWAPPIDLDDVKAIARAHAVTVNDVLVTCVADSLRTYLRRHGAVCHSVTWDVPVNLKPFDPTLPVVLGNSFALVQLELPTSIDDPVRALEVVRRRMDRIKRGHEAVVDFGLQALIARLDKRLYRASVDLLANRAIGVLTNVPGPDVPLHVAGRKVEGMLGWAPLTADQVMSFTIYSYDGKVFVGIAADAGLVPDHEEVVEGFSAALERIRLLTEAHPGP
ncbi:wax ester/triacylglycerol synthase family O-acyltransferase [Nocardia sp. N13]|uniref:wax ester/triacylglycerol synthase family O-acyltransferase n=1 Tax=Nocardioides sp. N13(2025) TaxID=3453405 RepID=UPI003F76AA00